MTRHVYLIAILLLGESLLAAQRPTAPNSLDDPQRSAATFKSSVDYVEVDAVVTDRNGDVVRSLRKDDFQVFEDGKRQTTSTFLPVDVPVEQHRAPSPADSSIPPDVTSNTAPFRGRLFVAVIDDLHTLPAEAQRIRTVAHEFVNNAAPSSTERTSPYLRGTSSRYRSRRLMPQASRWTWKPSLSR